jgi:hypothetical protein
MNLKNYFTFLTCLFVISVFSNNDRYRLVINDDPATTITIGWDQTSGSDPRVYYGTTDFGTNWQSYPFNKSVDRQISFRGMDNRYARLTGLIPNTSYYFVIRDSQGTSQRFWFKTAPADNSRLSFIAGGDSRNNRTPRQRANLLVSKLKPHAVFFGGDMTDDDTSTEWQNWFDDWQLTTANDGRMFPIIAARGNHEYNTSTIYNLFDTPNSNSYYAVTFGDDLIRCYTLNSEISMLGNQKSWLENDLANNSSARWKMAQYHKPMRPHTSGKSEGHDVYNAWAQLFYDEGVNLVVDCDSHTVKTTFPVKPSSGSNSEEGFEIDYANGTVYTGEGCWGAPLRSNDDDKVWTRNSASFNQFKLLFVGVDKIELRTIRVDNANNVGENSNSDPFQLPSNLDVFTPSFGEDVIDILPNNGGNPCPDAGTACDDGDPDTINDVEDGNCNCSGISQDGTINIVVSDDAEEGESGAMYLNSSDLELVFDDFNNQNNQTVGLRFDNIPLPGSATITGAYIQFTTDETNSVVTNLNINGQYSGDASPFATNTNNISNRTLTSSQNEVQWNNVPSWNSVGQSGINQRTPDISSLAQEILGHPNWVENNAMVFIITGSGTRFAESIDGSSSGAPRLVLSYTIESSEPTCGAPTNLAISSISSSGGELSWDTVSSASEGYQWVVMLSGVSPDPNNAEASGVENSSTTSIQISGLDSNTQYDAYVKSDCASESSVWSSPIVFTTLNEDGTINCDAPQNLNVNDIVGSSGVSLSWTLNTTATNGYEWLIMNEGISPDMANAFLSGAVSSNTNSVDIYGLQQEVSYDIYVRSICSGSTVSPWSDFLIFSKYCQAGAVDQDYEKIEFVSLNTINNSSTSNGGYEDFTDIYTTLSRGSTYGFQATDDNSYDEDHLIVWIDFNQDSDFEDAGEQVMVTSGQDPWTGNITIPSNALLGSTRMRIRLHAEDPYGPNYTPCGDSDYGQVEDYTVVIYDDYVYFNNSWTPQNPSGISSSSDNVLVVNGNPILENSTEVNNLVVQRQGSLSVENILSVNGDISNDGDIIFKSDINYTAQLDEFTGDISGSGEVTVHRFIPAATYERRAFRFLSTAVDSYGSIYDNWQEGGHSPNGYGIHITGSASGDNGFDASGSGNPSMFTFNNDSNVWENIPNTDQTNLNAGEGYLVMVRGDRNYDMTTVDPPNSDVTLRATGSLKTGTHQEDLSETENYFSYVGNPYQAIVNYNLLTKENLNPNFIWVWDPNLGNKGAYVTVLIPSGLNTTSSEASQFIQPGQAFLVQTSTNGPASISYNENAKTVDQLPLLVFSTQTPMIKMRLYTQDAILNNNNASDGLIINFNENGNNSLDDFDAFKFDNIDENISRNVDGVNISIEGRALPQNDEILDISINGYSAEDYVFIIDLLELNTNLETYLVDDFSGEINLLNEGSNQIEFSVNQDQPESLASDRFSLLFETTTFSVSDNGFGIGFSLYPSPTKDGLFTISTVGINNEEVNISIYDILGKKVLTMNENLSNDGKLGINASSLNSGVYIVELIQNKNKYSSKLIIE